MDDKQLALLLTAMSDQTTAMNRMADAMTGILVHLDPKQAAKFAAPGFMRPLGAYANFDWASIDATVIAFDRHGATEVEYNGAVFTRRRSGEDDPKGDAIRFSRVVGGTVEGKNLMWANLIKFADRKAKDPPKPLRGELAEKVEQAAASVAISAPIPVAIAPVKAIAGPEAPASQTTKPTLQEVSKNLLTWIAAHKQTLTVNQCRQANAKAVTWALTVSLPQRFIDSHTSPGDENSGPAMIQHAEALLNAGVAGKIPDPLPAQPTAEHRRTTPPRRCSATLNMNTQTYLTALAAAIADHQRHINALNKAQAEAERGNVPERAGTGEWNIESTSRTKLYAVGSLGCNCPAGEHHLLCWHTEAVAIAKRVDAAEPVEAAQLADRGETSPGMPDMPDIGAMSFEQFLDYLRDVRIN